MNTSIALTNYNPAVKADRDKFMDTYAIAMRFFSHNLWKLCTNTTGGNGPTRFSQDAVERIQHKIFQNFLSTERIYLLGNFPNQPPYNTYKAERITSKPQRSNTLSVPGLPSLGKASKEFATSVVRVVPRTSNPLGSLGVDGWYCANNNFPLDGQPRVHHSELDTGTAVTIDTLVQCAAMINARRLKHAGDYVVVVLSQYSKEVVDWDESNPEAEDNPSRIDHAFWLYEIVSLQPVKMLMFVEEKFLGLLTKVIPGAWRSLQILTATTAKAVPMDNNLYKVLPQVMKYFDETTCSRSMLTSSDLATTMRWTGKGTTEAPYSCEYENIDGRNPQDKIMKMLDEALDELGIE